eukprot:TRINITY_DN19793_c0_g1_i1.p1 TRINITY_DN19793_c0_g1~~TRINITY_DN19793_c0_g1_i1.p1  ORF type:complete len:2568 (+),score=394.86 TRINITY_DN19793_c0_g1_i1:192-7706(+)
MDAVKDVAVLGSLLHDIEFEVVISLRRDTRTVQLKEAYVRIPGVGKLPVNKQKWKEGFEETLGPISPEDLTGKLAQLFGHTGRDVDGLKAMMKKNPFLRNLDNALTTYADVYIGGPKKEFKVKRLRMGAAGLRMEYDSKKNGSIIISFAEGCVSFGEAAEICNGSILKQLDGDIGRKLGDCETVVADGLQVFKSEDIVSISDLRCDVRFQCSPQAVNLNHIVLEADINADFLKSEGFNGLRIAGIYKPGSPVCLKASFGDWRSSSLAQLAGDMKGYSGKTELVEMLGNVEVRNLLVFVCLGPGDARSMLLRTTIEVAGQQGKMFIAYHAGSKACAFALLPGHSSREGISIAQVCSRLHPGVSMLFNMLAIDIFIHYIVFATNWSTTAVMYREEFKDEIKGDLGGGSDAGMKDITTVLQRCTTRKSGTSAFAMSASVQTRDEGLWQLMGIGDAKLTGHVFFMTAEDPIIVVELGNGKLVRLNMPCRGELELSKREVAGRLTLDFQDPQNVTRATFSCELKYDREKRELEARLSLDGEGGGSINLGHWWSVLDCLELYNIRAAAAIKHQTAFVELSGGLRIVFDATSKQPDASAEFYLKMNPQDVTSSGISVLYYYYDNMTLVTLLRVFFRFSAEKANALDWTLSWFAPLRGVGKLLKMDRLPLKELPFTLLPADQRDDKNKICAFLMRTNVLPAENLNIYAVSTRWKLLMFDLHVFGAIVMHDIPLEPAEMAAVVKNAAMKNIKDNLEGATTENTGLDLEAELLAEFSPTSVKIGTFEVLKIDNPRSPGQPLICLIRVGQDFEFRFSGRIALFPSWSGGFSLETVCELVKDTGGAPKFLIHIEFSFLGVCFEGVVALTFHKMLPGARKYMDKLATSASDAVPYVGAALGTVIGTVGAVADWINIPKDVRLKLAVRSKDRSKGIGESILHYLREAVNNMMKAVSEQLERAVETLRKNEDKPIIGWFFTVCRWVVQGAKFLVNCLEKGLDFAMGLVQKIAQGFFDNILEVYHISISGSVGSDDICINTYFDLKIFGLRVKRGFDVSLKSFLKDTASILLGLICGRAGSGLSCLDQSKIHEDSPGEYCEPSDDLDSDEEGKPRRKLRPGSITGKLDSDLLQNMPQVPDGQKAEMNKHLQKLRKLSKQVEVELAKKLHQGKIIPDPEKTPDTLRTYPGQFDNLFTGQKAPIPEEQECYLCGKKGIPTSKFAKHLQEECPVAQDQQEKCRHCERTFSVLELAAHEATCAKKPQEKRQCTSRGCERAGLVNCSGDACQQCSKGARTGDCIKYHLANECTGKVPCARCGKDVVSKYLQTHRCTDKNGKQWEACRKCRVMIEKAKLAQHMKTCEAVKCECGELVAKQDLEDHKKHECPKRTITCAEPIPESTELPEAPDGFKITRGKGCRTRMARDVLEEHLQKVCTEVGIECLKCGSQCIPDGTTSAERVMQHRGQCTAEEKDCPLECGYTLTPNEMADHVNNYCPNRDKRCYWPCCDRIFEELEDEDEIRDCGECNKQCDDAKEVMDHLAFECDEFKPPCPMACGKNIKFKEFADHWQIGASQQGDCRTAWIPCPMGSRCKDADISTCGAYCEEACGELGRHISKLRTNLSDDTWTPFVRHVNACVKLPCPFSGGQCFTGDDPDDKGVVYERLNEHVRECEYIKTKCVFGCGEELPMNDAMKEAMHLLQDCPKFMIGCTKCGVDMPFKSVPFHLAQECEKNYVDCVLMCGTKLLKKEEADHLSTKCTRFRMYCMGNLRPDMMSQEKGDLFRRSPQACQGGYLKKDEIDHISKHHMAEIDEDMPQRLALEAAREGIEEGNNLSLLTAWSLGMLASSNRMVKQLERISFIEKRCQQIHIETELFPCPFCDMPILVEEVSHHLRFACEGYFVECPEDGCEGQDITLKDLVAHIVKDCDFAKKNCHQCSKEIIRKRESQHVSTECERNNSYQCWLCYETMQQYAIADHIQNKACKAYTEEVACSEVGVFFHGADQPGCGVRVMKGELVKHWMQDCSMHTVSCPLCGEEGIAKKDITSHMLECPKFVIKCSFCEEAVPRVQADSGRPDWSRSMIDHLFQACKNLSMPCGWCEEDVAWSAMASHLAGKKSEEEEADTGKEAQGCEMFLAQCPFKCPGDSSSHRKAAAADRFSSFGSAEPESKTLLDWPSLPLHLVSERKEGKTRRGAERKRLGLCQSYEICCPKQMEGKSCYFPHDLPAKFEHDKPPFGSKRMPRDRMQHHIWHECGGNIRPCNNGDDAEKCGEEISAAKWEDHQAKCQYKLVVCEKCGLPVQRRYLDDHDCQESQEACKFCGKEIARKSLKAHELTCPKRLVKAHQGKLNKNHDPAGDIVAHDWDQQHGGTTSSHSEGFELSTGHLVASIVTLGIPNMLGAHVNFWKCCGRPRGNPNCKYPLRTCTSCGESWNYNATPPSPCKQKCRRCQLEARVGDDSAERQPCQQLCRRCHKDPNLVPTCLSPVCTACAEPIRPYSHCPKAGPMPLDCVDPEIRAKRGYIVHTD